ncbi:hypothetical protein GCM10028822_00060 [Hymenobacter terrigena]
MSDAFTLIASIISEHPQATATVAGIYGIAKPFLAKVLGPSTEELGEVGREYVKKWRTGNAAQTAAQASTMLDDAGIAPQPVAPKVLLPLLEAASLEDDEFLRTQWAALLANAATPHRKVPVEPGFVEILKQLTPVQVRILTVVSSEAGTTGQSSGVTYMAQTHKIQRQLQADGVSVEEFEIALDNLIRLRLCSASGMAPLNTTLNSGNNAALMMAAALGHGTANVGLTKLGLAFLAACSAPNSSAT